MNSSSLLIVALPNVLYVTNRLKLAAGYFEYEESGLMDNTHFRFYSYASAQRLLENAGFDIVSYEVSGHVPLPGLRRLAPPLATVVDKLSLRAAPGLFGFQFILSARVKS